jgi:sodium/potassium-transporting ATPase subunit alpha
VGAVLVFISWKPLGNPPAPANLGLAIVLVCVWLIQSAFNMWQDWSSAQVMKSIKNSMLDAVSPSYRPPTPFLLPTHCT